MATDPTGQGVRLHGVRLMRKARRKNEKISNDKINKNYQHQYRNESNLLLIPYLFKNIKQKNKLSPHAHIENIKISLILPISSFYSCTIGRTSFDYNHLTILFIHLISLVIGSPLNFLMFLSKSEYSLLYMS